VFGVEADGGWADTSGFGTLNATSLCAGGRLTKNTWLSTLRGRAGYALDRFLIYGAAGAALGNVRATSLPVRLCGAAPLPVVVTSDRWIVYHRPIDHWPGLPLRAMSSDGELEPKLEGALNTKKPAVVAYWQQYSRLEGSDLASR